MRVPLVEYRCRLSLVSDGAGLEFAMTQGKADNFGKDRLVQNCQDPGRCPQLTGISSMHFLLG
jgi:hypothetical protein